MSFFGSLYESDERVAVERVAPTPRVRERPRLEKTWWSMRRNWVRNLAGASGSIDWRAEMRGSMCGWQRVRPCPMIWKERVMMLAPSTVMATGIDMYALPRKLFE